MAEYINIKGQNIEVVASDPANPTIGQIWYNSTSNTLKGGGFQVSAWATGGNLSTGRYIMAGAGTKDAGIAAGGLYPSTPYAITEEYNGTSWSGGGALNTARYALQGAGTQTATLAFGGESPGGNQTATEEYNGSAWSSGGKFSNC
jgi:hypothetical protein